MSSVGQGKRKAKDLNPDALKKLKAIEEQGGITIRLLVTKAQVGAIIGKGGENVKRLRDENDVFVSVLWSKHKERVAEYKGISANLAAALRQSAEFFGPLPENKEGHYQINLLVHQFQVGGLIGKGGALAKQCQQETGARVEVGREKKGESTEKVVSLTGPLDSIRDASQWVLNQLATNPLRHDTTTVLYKPSRPLSFQSNNQPQPLPQGATPYYPGPPLGLPIGGPLGYGGVGRQYTPFGTPAVGSTPGSPYTPAGPGSRFSSPPSTRNPYAYGDIGGSPASSIMSPGPDPRSSGVSGGISAAPLPELKIRSSTELQIPINCIAGVIGRGGSIIQNIYRQTQASIKIAEQVNGEKFRVATITGTEASIRNAVQLIQNRIAELSASPQIPAY